ncbi:hypothetical protein VULLAG_LOCUS6857 [Vulpes lagopus]
MPIFEQAREWQASAGPTSAHTCPVLVDLGPASLGLRAHFSGTPPSGNILRTQPSASASSPFCCPSALAHINDMSCKGLVCKRPLQCWDLRLTDLPGLPKTKGFLRCGTSSAKTGNASQAQREESVILVLVGVTEYCESCLSQLREQRPEKSEASCCINALPVGSSQMGAGDTCLYFS